MIDRLRVAGIRCAKVEGTRGSSHHKLTDSPAVALGRARGGAGVGAAHGRAAGEGAVVRTDGGPCLVQRGIKGGEAAEVAGVVGRAGVVQRGLDIALVAGEFVSFAVGPGGTLLAEGIVIVAGDNSPAGSVIIRGVPRWSEKW